jgi:hypothetical protein
MPDMGMEMVNNWIYAIQFPFLIHRNRIGTEYLKTELSRMPVAHACIPSYSVGKNQEDLISKPGWQIICKTLSQNTLLQKIGLVEWLKVKALSSSQILKKKRKEKSTIGKSTIYASYLEYNL